MEGAIRTQARSYDQSKTSWWQAAVPCRCVNKAEQGQSGTRCSAGAKQRAGMCDHHSLELMIDDRLYTYEAVVFLRIQSNILHSTEYVIEGVDFIDLPRYKKYFDGKPYQMDFLALARPGLPLNSNSLVQGNHRS
jgi:hypothetical protein